MKLLVSGCSITHGAELYNNFMHPENIKLSYSQHLADRLNLELLNVALSAGSNEYIFHSLVEELMKNNDIHSVVVMWTTLGRLSWKSNNRYYFFLGNFASSMQDLINFEMHQLKVGDCWFTGDSDQIVQRLSEIHKFIVTDYFDDQEESKKLNHYRQALADMCNSRNIRLINLDWGILNGVLNSNGQHPNAEQHKILADRIYKTYYENI